MLTIYKYSLQLVDDPDIVLPQGARILTVQAQHETPCIWALVDPEAALEPVGFRVVGTGHPFPDADDWPAYVGTFQLMGGQLVFHVFTKAPS